MRGKELFGLIFLGLIAFAAGCLSLAYFFGKISIKDNWALIAAGVTVVVGTMVALGNAIDKKTSQIRSISNPLQPKELEVAKDRNVINVIFFIFMPFVFIILFKIILWVTVFIGINKEDKPQLTDKCIGYVSQKKEIIYYVLYDTVEKYAKGFANNDDSLSRNDAADFRRKVLAFQVEITAKKIGSNDSCDDALSDTINNRLIIDINRFTKNYEKLKNSKDSAIAFDVVKRANNCLDMVRECFDEAYVASGPYQGKSRSVFMGPQADIIENSKPFTAFSYFDELSNDNFKKKDRIDVRSLFGEQENMSFDWHDLTKKDANTFYIDPDQKRRVMINKNGKEIYAIRNMLIKRIKGSFKIVSLEVDKL